MKKPDLSNYSVLFLDMNGTFMFGHDRLDDTQDFYASYLRLGGQALSAAELHTQVLQCCDFLRQRYDNAVYFTNFPRVQQALHSLGLSRDLELIAAVIAAHEIGQVPDWAAASLRKLALSHKLAVVSNVWADGENWRAGFQRNGLDQVFSYQCYSSELGVIKPAPEIFLHALSAMAVAPQAALFIGDSLERDIFPAKKLGLSTLLVGSASENSAVDFHVQSLRDLID